MGVLLLTVTDHKVDHQEGDQGEKEDADPDQVEDHIIDHFRRGTGIHLLHPLPKSQIRKGQRDENEEDCHHERNHDSKNL